MYFVWCKHCSSCVVLQSHCSLSAFSHIGVIMDSYEVKNSRPDAFNIDKGEYGVPDTLTYGLPNTKLQLEKSHPLENVENNHQLNQDSITFDILRKVQGLHAPLKLKMERKIVNKNGGRLPFMQSSNASFDSLTGRDVDIGFADFLNPVEFREQTCQPHAQVEKSLGIL